MFISETTKNGIRLQAHASASDAVSHLLSELDGHSGFWASEDGESIVSDGGSWGFSLRVYDSAEDAIKAQRDLDEDTLPLLLRGLADAIEDGVSRGL